MTFRKNHKLNPKTKTVNFVLAKSGLGDILNFLPALNWIAETQPHVNGVIYCNDWLELVAKHFFNKFSTWRIRPVEWLAKEVVQRTPTYFIDQTRGYVNPAGAHLVDLGFIYFTNQATAPVGFSHLLQFDDSLRKAQITSGVGKYAVITPVATCSNRGMDVFLFDKLKTHTLSLGLEVVVLGKETNPPTKDYSRCINLINKTSLMEAASIIQNAALVIGVDNGLLHLAGMTKTPIVFGYTTVSSKLREPRRPHGVCVNVEIPESLLPCISCNEKMRFTFSHDFKYCFYKDDKCVEILSQSDLWFKAIDEILTV